LHRTYPSTLLRLLAAVALGIAVLAVALPASAEPGFRLLQSMPAPAATSGGAYGDVSCPTASACTAVGWDLSAKGGPTAITEIAGTWGTPTPIAPPSGGGTLPSALQAVSCADAMDCTAVGDDPSADNGVLPLVATEAAGSWGAATTLALPGNADATSSQDSHLTDVDCVSAGNCMAVGNYLDKEESYRSMAVEQSGGVWSAPIELPDIPSPPFHNFAAPTSISCTDSTDCVAVGIAVNTHSAWSSSYVWTEAAGTWSTPSLLRVPGNHLFTVLDVDCPDASTCIAVGESFTENTGPGVAVATAGSWSDVRYLPIPQLSPLAKLSSFTNVSCTTDTTCEAVGSLLSFVGTSDQTVAGAATWSNGAWSSIARVRGVGPGSTRAVDSGLLAVSCAASAACTAIGDAAQSNDAPPHPFSAALTPARRITAPQAPIDVGGRGILGGVLPSWMPPTDDGGSPVVTYKATAEPTGHSCRTTTDSCTIRGLANGVHYRITVRDATAYATSAPARGGLILAGERPRPPALVSATGGDASVAITWRPSSTPAGEPVLHYVVRLTGHGTIRGCTTAAFACRFSGLAAHADYAAIVVAQNASGRSTPSVPVRTRTR
jgi:hypothetical protein